VESSLGGDLVCRQACIPSRQRYEQQDATNSKECWGWNWPTVHSWGINRGTCLSRFWGSKIWSSVPWGYGPRITALVRVNSNCKRQIYPLVREGAAQKKRSKLFGSKNILVSDSTCRFHTKISWLTWNNFDFSSQSRVGSRESRKLVTRQSPACKEASTGAQKTIVIRSQAKANKFYDRGRACYRHLLRS
jgi:hypothetical protein